LTHGIHVVEDNPLNRELLRDWLEVEGQEVWSATDLKASHESIDCRDGTRPSDGAGTDPTGCIASLSKPINFQGLREQSHRCLRDLCVLGPLFHVCA
jgi:hypothetical protein